MRLTLTALACLLVAVLADAADWPQFRGPDRTGVSKETGLLKAWPKDGPALVWTFKGAGLGFSSMSIVEGKLYTLGSDKGDKDETVICLDAAKGTPEWSAVIGPVVNAPDNSVWGDGPRSTPTIDGKFLYALGSQGILVCLDISAKGKEIWRVDLVKDLGGELMTGWGYSESPLVDGKLLLCTPGGPKGTVAALDKATGKVVWRSTGLTHAAPYSSMVAADIHGVRQYIQASYIDEKQGGFLNGFDAKTGKVLWSENIFKQHSYAIAPSPIVKGNLVYCTSGYGGGCHLFEIGKDQKATEKYTKKVQKSVKDTHGGVVLIGDYIYGHSEGLGWVCQKLESGAVEWSERTELTCTSGATTAADGMLYLYTDDGEVALVEAKPGKEMKIVSSFKIPATSHYPTTRKTSRNAKVWSHPVVANGYLFVRDEELIYCYDVKGKK